MYSFREQDRLDILEQFGESEYDQDRRHWLGGRVTAGAYTGPEFRSGRGVIGKRWFKVGSRPSPILSLRDRLLMSTPSPSLWRRSSSSSFQVHGVWPRGFAWLLLAAAAGCQANATKVAPAEPPVVPVSQPLQRDFTSYVDFTGRTEAVYSVDIRPRVTGYLVDMPFVEGIRGQGRGFAVRD